MKRATRKLILNKSRLLYITYAFFLATSIIFSRSKIETFLGMDSHIWLRAVCYPACAVFLMFLVVIESRYTVREIITSTILLLVFTFCYINSGSGVYLLGTLFVIAAKGVKLDKIPLVTWLTLILVLLLIVTLALSGKIENVVVHHYRVIGDTVRIRQSLGFNHPNALGAQLAQLSICWLWIKWDKWRVYHNLFWVLLLAVAYFLCNSQSSVVVIFLVMLMVFCSKAILRFSKERRWKAFEKWGRHFVWFCPAFTFIASHYYNPANPLMSLIDAMTSKRISYARRFLNIYAVSFLGSNRILDEEISGSDNVYANIVVKYGIVVLVIIIVGMYLLFCYAAKERLYPLMISIFVYSFYGLTEGYCYQLVYNFVLIYLSIIVFNKEARREVSVEMYARAGT